MSGRQFSWPGEAVPNCAMHEEGRPRVPLEGDKLRKC